MDKISRRRALQTLGATTFAASGGMLFDWHAAAADLKYSPEKNAEKRAKRYYRG
jgi:hypothetical protein